MKTIIHENHYQKRLWEDACFEHDLKSGKLDDLLGDEADFEKHRAASLEETKRNYSEYEKSTQTFPSLIGRLKFKLASRYAVSLARHYEMNVHVKASDSLGIIELSCDEIMFDTVSIATYCRNSLHSFGTLSMSGRANPSSQLPIAVFVYPSLVASVC